ncbi:MAG: DinB family protein [Gemmatimonadetes bacterium]|nr:DinB family protein [Gemmatimonadota bacterium]
MTNIDTAFGRPHDDEYAPFYAGYVGLVPAGDVRHHLRAQLQETLATLTGVTDAVANKAYGPGKWTLKEVVGHMSDAERVFAYRLLRIARADATPLSAFDENAWVPASGAGDRSLDNLLLEFVAVRFATSALLDSLSPDAWVRRGTASGKSISVRALAYIAAGHERHHVRILRERYLGNG